MLKHKSFSNEINAVALVLPVLTLSAVSAVKPLLD
jgi:hypothetical protein